MRSLLHVILNHGRDAAPMVIKIVIAAYVTLFGLSLLIERAPTLIVQP
jgi:hypothetical protein